MAQATLDPLIQVQQLPPRPAATAGANAPELTFRTKDLQPPTEFWVTPDDYLAVGVTNNLTGVTLQVQCRLWTPDGKLSCPATTITPPADRVLRYTTLPMYYGWMFAAVVFATGSPLPQQGQTYVSLQIVRTPLQTFSAVLPLGASYIMPNGPVQWPYPQNASPLSTTGSVFTQTVGAPAVGTEWSQTVPTGAVWRPRFAFFTFTTSSVITTRAPALVVTDGSNVLGVMAGGNSQNASAVITYTFAPTLTLSAAGFDVSAGMPGVISLQPGWTIGSRTYRLQPTDQYSGIILTIEEVPAS